MDESMCQRKPRNSRAARAAPRYFVSGLAVVCWGGACGGDLHVGWDTDAGAQLVADTGGAQTPDSGATEPEGLLPIGPRNPMLLCNDGHIDSWQGEFAVLFAANGGPPLVGLIVNTSGNWTDLDVNLTGWQDLIAAARLSGLGELVDPTPSDAPVLVRPDDGDIAATTPNGSMGARLIIDASRQHSTPDLPLVIVTGGRLTDVADAYLLDPTVTERVVVLSSLGSSTSSGAEMGVPNGEMDTWADVIVAQKFRYIQVSEHYEQSADLPASLLPELPAGAFSDWVRVKQPDVWELPVAADQVSVLALALPEFVTGLKHVAPPNTQPGIPELVDDPAGGVSVVTSIDGALPSARFQQMLLALPSSTLQ